MDERFSQLIWKPERELNILLLYYVLVPAIMARRIIVYEDKHTIVTDFKVTHIQY